VNHHHHSGWINLQARH